MEPWISSFRRAQRLLSHHRPAQALVEFERALERCTARGSRARLLFYRGLAQARLGDDAAALASWGEASSLATGRVLKLCARWVNGYGMRRMASVLLDDLAAFKAIHERRYLSHRGSQRFCSACERDAVSDIIEDAFFRLSRSGLLCSLSCAEKLALFKRARVSMPFLYLEDALEAYRGPDIQISIDWVAMTRKTGLSRR